MKELTVREFTKKAFKLIQEAPLLITATGKPKYVVLPYEQWEALRNTNKMTYGDGDGLADKLEEITDNTVTVMEVPEDMVQTRTTYPPLTEHHSLEDQLSGVTGKTRESFEDTHPDVPHDEEYKPNTETFTQKLKRILFKKVV